MNLDLLPRATSTYFGSDNRSLTDTSEPINYEAQKTNEVDCKKVLNQIFEHSAFTSKYDIAIRDLSAPMIYVFTNMSSKYTYIMEALPTVVQWDSYGTGKKVEELEYHDLFESVIRRYTKSNQALRETRSSQFCYRVTVKVEAVPPESLIRPYRFILLREYLILHHIWESYLAELNASACGPDQMIGFPMPFEYCNIAGSQEFKIPEDLRGSAYFNINGELESIAQATIPASVPNASSTGLVSSLSYMSYEKLGPSLNYLLDLMRSQGKVFTLSSALKVYDQLICRLMVMHKYGVVHSDPNPSCLFFGPDETCNVLYISEFGSAVVKPKHGSAMPRFHDRFVSFLRFREKRCHFAHDLESAFYVFLYLILGRLPWDARVSSTQKTERSEFSSGPVSGYTDKPLNNEHKEKFWQSQDVLSRLLLLVEYEYSESLYQSFSIDLIESLYAKTKENLSQSSSISSTTYMKEIATPGSQVYNMYFGLRKMIVTYFRFESLSPSLRDTHAKSKVQLLRKQCTKDIRMAWDLSQWCWSFMYLDPNPKQAGRNQRISRMSKSR